MVLGLVACGPSVATNGGTESTTSQHGNETASTTASTAASTTGGVGTTTTSAADESGNGEYASEVGTDGAVAGCKNTGQCDESCLQWEATVAEEHAVVIEHVAALPDGSFVTVEVHASTSALLVGYDVAGVRTFEHEVYADDTALARTLPALAVADDGTIALLVTEGSPADFAYETTLEVRSSAGTPEWETMIGDASQSVAGTALAFGGDSSIVVGAVRYDGPLSNRLAVSFDSTHEPGWSLDLEEGEVSAVAKIYMGDTILAGTDGDGLWAARLGIDGTVQWSGLSGSPSIAAVRAYDLAIQYPDDLLLVGESFEGGGLGAPWLGQVDGTGDFRLSAVDDAPVPGPNMLLDVEVAIDGRIFVGGVRTDAPGVVLRYVQELDCSGIVAWTWTRSSPPEYPQATPGGLAWSNTTDDLVYGGSDFAGEDLVSRGFVGLLNQ